jgi:hypothetical protein
MDPYPGDDKAVQPVWSYSLDSKWKMIIYFVKSGYPQNEKLPKELGNKLYSIDLIPKKPQTIDVAKFKSIFKKRHVIAADAAWDEYSDNSGLAYLIYTGIAGRKILTNQLNRISYRSSTQFADSIIKESIIKSQIQ